MSLTLFAWKVTLEVYVYYHDIVFLHNATMALFTAFFDWFAGSDEVVYMISSGYDPYCAHLITSRQVLNCGLKFKIAAKAARYFS